jgi:hypothetical protein
MPGFPGYVLVKTITTGGTFRFGKRTHLASAVIDHLIGLEETGEEMWTIHFHTVLLATLGERDDIIQS